MENSKEVKILNQLKVIQEKQFQNDQSLRIQGETEQHVQHINRRSNHLFSQLYDAWREDKVFAQSIEENRIEVQHQE